MFSGGKTAQYDLSSFNIILKPSVAWKRTIDDISPSFQIADKDFSQH